MPTSANPFGRRDVLTMFAGGALGATLDAASVRAAPPAPASRPNLILFFIDECRADALSSYGNPVCRTPNFDLLARQGTRFAECHVQFPVCGASRCSLLTGLPTANTGHRSLYYFLRRDEPNLFRYLKEGGYDTFWFGKNDALAPESFAPSLTEWHDIPNFERPAAGARGGADGFDASAPNLMLIRGAQVDRRQTADYRLLQLAIRILERKEQDRPFCIFLPLNQPHPPYLAPAGFDTLYKPGDLPPLAPPGLAKKPNFHDAMRRAYHLDKAGEADFRAVRATYYGQVSYADWLLGELLEALDRTGRAKDTVIVAGSDHGDYAGDYGLVEKWPSGLESCLTHVPLVARMPGGVAGHVVGEMTELYDIMASFMELGQVTPKQVHFGRSFVPQLHGAAGDPDRAAFTEGGYDTFEPQAFEPPLEGPHTIYTAKHDLQNKHPETVTRAASVATPEHKFIARPGGQFELYDRIKDPLETHNLIDDRAYSKVRMALTTRLMDRYISTTGVPPFDRDGRGVPPFDLKTEFPNDEGARQRLLDR